MNKHQFNGAIKGVLGRRRAAAGPLAGTAPAPSPGDVERSEGRMQKAYNELKAALKNSRHS